jgi:hypothetical protein
MFQLSPFPFATYVFSDESYNITCRWFPNSEIRGSSFAS